MLTFSSSLIPEDRGRSGGKTNGNRFPRTAIFGESTYPDALRDRVMGEHITDLICFSYQIENLQGEGMLE